MSANPQVTFRTEFFEPIAGEEEATSPGRYGKALAQWLAERLQERGVVAEDVIPEDFGWAVFVSRHPFRLWLGCGNIEGSTTEWTVFPVAERSMLQRLLKRGNPAAEIEKLRAHLADIVPSIPGVSGITWE